MKTILIVDDEQVSREALSDSLSLENYKVLQADNGEDCLLLVEDQKIDLILLEIQMPGMDGLEVIEKINEYRERGKKPHIIALTNKGDFETITKVLNSGVLHYFIKADYSLDDVPQVLREILE